MIILIIYSIKITYIILCNILLISCDASPEAMLILTTKCSGFARLLKAIPRAAPCVVYYN